MASTAVRVAKWLERGSPVTVGVPAAGDVGGVPILQQQFGTGLRLVVEIAWGAQAGSDPSGWVWSDITGDVQIANNGKITITVGRSDEASTTQPASLALTLDNRLNRYSESPLSPSYPNVKRNVPFRVRVFYQSVPFTRFAGYATSFAPAWDTTGAYATVKLSANGALRRLAQGTATLRSPLERAVAASKPQAYWPMEDTANSSSLASPIPGVAPMGANNLTLASNTGLPGSQALPVYGNAGTSTVIGEVPAWSSTKYWEVHWYHLLTQPGADTTLMFINSTGTYKTWEVIADSSFGVASGVGLNVYDSLGNKTNLFNGVVFGNFYSAWAYVKLFVSESAGVITWVFEVFPAAGGGGGFVSNTLSGTVGIVTAITSPPSAGLNGMSLGHIAVWNAPPNLGDIDNASGGYNNQSPVTRLSRLCTEQGEQVSVYGTSNSSMGIQTVDTFMNLVRACETVDEGILFDGINPGLTYVSRDMRENAVPILTLDASQQDLTPPFSPVDDDQFTVNYFTASRQGGSSYIAQDTTSVLSTNNIGTYASSNTFNTFADSDLQQYAWWAVHLGTYQGYRFPTIAFSIHRRPQYLLAWLQTMLLTPISVVNVVTALTQMPPETLTGVLQGYTETIDQFTWEVTANCTPYELWHIATIAAEAGDTSVNAWRLESDGANLVTGVAAGATSLSVATPSGPVWTTVADDMPFDISVAGIRVTVTNVSGASSPQTFTVNPVAYPLPANAPITLWHQPVLGL